jgi:hypothetical protein
MTFNGSIWNSCNEDDTTTEMKGTYFGIFTDSPVRLTALLGRPQAPFPHTSFNNHFVDFFEQLK